MQKISYANRTIWNDTNESGISKRQSTLSAPGKVETGIRKPIGDWFRDAKTHNLWSSCHTFAYVGGQCIGKPIGCERRLRNPHCGSCRQSIPKQTQRWICHSEQNWRCFGELFARLVSRAELTIYRPVGLRQHNFALRICAATSEIMNLGHSVPVLHGKFFHKP